MSRQFSVGDTVRLHHAGSEAEVIGLKEDDPTHVLCGWFDDAEEWQECYFRVDNLGLVRTKAAEEVKA